MSSTETVLDHHLEAFVNQDRDEIMIDYGDDSVVVTNMGVFRGLDGIERLFTDLLYEFSQEDATIELNDTIVQGDFAYLLWHGETPDNIYEFCTATFYIPDETITFQSFAGKIQPQN
ncbi:nuclear transport factor 2 family protein [Halobacteriaceae archaeon SHR40]|uniref:nuclear transport factor 2 family protein n=1 Tax=Halovenus amylolytica TaxID=2500550 RepID=UPI000FE40693